MTTKEFTKKRAEIVENYMAKFPDEDTMTLAKALYKKHSQYFNNLDSVRGMIRMRRGSHGKSTIANKSFIRPKFTQKANPFEIPESSKQDAKPYILPIANNNILIISDLHIPYHDVEAVTLALKYGVEQNVNTIIINGDLIDFHRVSRFEPDPASRDTKYEFDTAKAFLVSLRKFFPSQKIVFVKGNHDERWEHYLFRKCVEIFEDPYFSLEARLGLNDLHIELIDGYTLIKAGKLNILHGDKIIRGVFAPVNAARGLFIRAKANTLIGHTHSVSKHSEGNINGEKFACWSIGCLCDLHPKYDRYNTKHSLGFAHVSFDRLGDFTVNNFEIINGKLH
jgi:predicted phosphodiesterase